MALELGVLPARCHRQQLLVHLPCLGRGLFDRLGQLGRPRLGRLLRRFQLAPFGPHRLDLGPELLILLPQRGELLLQLSGRGDRLGGLGQLLEALPCGGQRLVQLDERIGGRCTRRAGRLLGVRFGRLLDQDRAGELRLLARERHRGGLDGTPDPDERGQARAPPGSGKSLGARVITGHSSLPDAWYRSARAAPMGTSLNLRSLASSLITSVCHLCAFDQTFDVRAPF